MQLFSLIIVTSAGCFVGAQQNEQASFDEFKGWCDDAPDEYEDFYIRNQIPIRFDKHECIQRLVMPSLQMLRVEAVNYEQPTVYILRDFITPSHTRRLKKQIDDFNLVPLRVYALSKSEDADDSDSKKRNTLRNANGTFLYHYETPYLAALTRVITGTIPQLDLTAAERYNAVTYKGGVGHHVTHVDAMPSHVKPDQFTLKYGNRMATIIVYLQKPRKGGDTLFVNAYFRLKSVQPGDAVLFFNLKSDETIDDETHHGGCPLVSGQKSILTMWIRRQMLTWPCGLRENQPYQWPIMNKL